MKCGVLTFSYRHVASFAAELEERGSYTINLGDNMQSIATRALFRTLGIADEDVVDVDRDSLATYDGPPVRLLMNGVFPAHCFPLSPLVTPVFIGFPAKAETVLPWLDFFRHHAPIGCRDPHTQALFASHGIAAEVTGCVTLTLPPRDPRRHGKRVMVVQGDGAGRLPAEAIARMPPALLAAAFFVYQRMPVFEHPLSPETMRLAERYAARLLETYRLRAALVLTSLHHAASPCMASGIPVVLCRRDANPRFGHLATLLPLHLPGALDAMDWQPRPPNLEAVRARILGLARERFLEA